MIQASRIIAEVVPNEPATRDGGYAVVRVTPTAPMPGAWSHPNPKGWTFNGKPAHVARTEGVVGEDWPEVLIFFDPPATQNNYRLKMPTDPAVLTREGGLLGPVDVIIEYNPNP